MYSWIVENLELLRRKKPLVQNITNFVVMNTTANALLSIGASPVMAHAVEELEDMLKLADSLVINIGTLDSHWIKSMEEAAEIASKLQKPVVLDPVGAGATRLRTETALRILSKGKITVLRGNYSEIASLLGEDIRTRGVDSSTYSKDNAMRVAMEAAKKFGVVASVTGPIDFVSDGKRLFAIENGHPMLGRVTGTGCIASALTGAFIAVGSPLEGSVSALVTFGVAAEMAYKESTGPGTFHVKLYDWLYRIDSEVLQKKAKVKEIVLER